jgi:hypothetical protein
MPSTHDVSPKSTGSFHEQDQQKNVGQIAIRGKKNAKQLLLKFTTDFGWITDHPQLIGLQTGDKSCHSDKNCLFYLLNIR